jgi:hypothetical protein
MFIVQKVGHVEYEPEDLYVLPLPRLIANEISFDGIMGNFITCLALDGSQVSDLEIQTFASALIQAGCSYFCCWGPDCERVHDLIDSANLALAPDGPWAETTWHDNEPLSEAIWFSFNSARPDPAYEDTTHAVVGISIGNEQWSSEILTAYSDPHRFSKQILKQ